MKNKRSSAGFTLLEVLVVVLIMMMLLAGGLATYIRLNNRQTLINTGRQLQLLMRTAQKAARVQEKPVGPPPCTHLKSYAVISTSGNRGAQLIAECENQNYVVQTLEFPTDFSTIGPLDMHFMVLQGGVINPSFVTLQNESGAGLIDFEVGAGGDISDLIFNW